MALSSLERSLLAVCASLAVADIVLVSGKGVAVDVAGYATTISAGIGMLLAGQFYRTWQPDEGIALAATAAGLLIVFSNVASVFNYLLLPRPAAPIDPILIQIDALLGYSWPGLVSAVAASPFVTATLRVVYLTSFPQLLIAVLFLGFKCERQRLHAFLTAGMLSALLAIAWWTLFPSSGASACSTLPEAVNAIVRPIVGVEYRKDLYRLLEYGASRISPQDALGLIGFPSYHTVMAILCVYAFLRNPIMRLFVLPVNALMIPAILVHGGHNLVDAIGGFALGLSSLAIAKRLVSALEQKDSLFERSVGRESGILFPAD